MNDTFHKFFCADSRSLDFINDDTVDLVVTSPPYWDVRDYGSPRQIGFGQGYEEYLASLTEVVAECVRVLKNDGRLCVNVMDYCSRSSKNSRHKVYPIHAELVCRTLSMGGVDYAGMISWRKKSQKNPSGGGVFMGSYPYPPNGMISFMNEFILVFKKTIGKKRRVPPKDEKRKSVIGEEQWRTWFDDLWVFPGVDSDVHPAVFPKEIPYRLISMFSWVGDTVLDPFCGSGTTNSAAADLGRNSIGVDCNPKYVRIAKSSMGFYPSEAVFLSLDNAKV